MEKLITIFLVTNISFGSPFSESKVGEFFLDLNPNFRDLNGWIIQCPPETALYYQLEEIIPNQRKILELEFKSGNSEIQSIEEIDEFIEARKESVKNAYSLSLNIIPKDSDVYFVRLDSSPNAERHVSIFGEFYARGEEIIAASILTTGDGIIRFSQEKWFDLGLLVEFGL